MTLAEGACHCKVKRLSQFRMLWEGAGFHRRTECRLSGAKQTFSDPLAHVGY